MIRMIEGFDTKQILTGEGKWTGAWVNPDFPSLAPQFYSGRFTGSSIGGTRQCPYLQVLPTEVPSKWIIGAAVFAYDSAFPLPIIGIRSSNTNNFDVVVCTQHGMLFVVLNATYQATSSGTNDDVGGILNPQSDWHYRDLDPILLPSRWVYVELEVDMRTDDTGSFKVYLDEEKWIERNGIRTVYGYGDIVQIGSNFVWCTDNTYAPIHIDDVYICDGVGTAYNKPLGDVYVATSLPIADGTDQGWASNTGGAAYLAVDDPEAHDGDATYIYSDIDGAAQSFKMSPVEIPQPLAVQVTAVASKLRLAAGWIGLYMRQELKDVKTSMFKVTRGYKAYSTIWTKTPYGTQFSSHDLNEIEFGVYAKVETMVENQ